jgi:ABC-type nitrate/sulfonate/bicarbonate transport system substrate-binding protein
MDPAMKAIRSAAAMGAAVALSVGCGGGTGAETTTSRSSRTIREIGITLDGNAGAENVGVLMAQKRDYFDEAGLKVAIYAPIGPLRPIPYVLEGAVLLSISHGPEVGLAQQRQAPIAVVGNVVPEPTAAMIWLKKSQIDGIADLKGKTIAVEGLAYQRDLLQKILAQAGMSLDDVNVEPVEYDLVPALVSGRVEAIFGGSWNVEGIELEERGLDPVVTKVQDLGIPPYKELVFIARQDRLEKAPQLIHDFLLAVNRGTEAAIDDPQAAAQAIIDETGKTGRKTIEAEVEATLPLLSTSGAMRSEQAGELNERMRGNG